MPLNKIVLQGRLTRDPELKHTQSGIANCLFTVAWSEKYKEVETKCFLLCKAWRGTAEFLCKYFHKGQELVLEGHMISERWGDDEHDTTYCIADKINFCGSKAQNEQQSDPKEKPATDFVEVQEGSAEEIPFT